jgi:hypothetical protein
VSVTVNLTRGRFLLDFEAGIQVTDSARPAAINDTVVFGKGGLQTLTQTLSDGTGANKANKMYAATVSLAAAATTTLVLSDGSLVQDGQSVAFTIVRRVLIALRTPATGVKLRLGGAGTHPWAPWWSDQTITEDFPYIFWRAGDIDGFAVSSGSHDQLKVANPSGSTQAADLVLVGE